MLVLLMLILDTVDPLFIFGILKPLITSKTRGLSSSFPCCPGATTCYCIMTMAPDVYIAADFVRTSGVPVQAVEE